MVASHGFRVQVAPAQASLAKPPPWRVGLRSAVRALERRGGTGHGGYAIACPSRCGATIALCAKPARERTSWPRVLRSA
eukprot:2163787-Alexandrium_andersonii.AAC.1